MTKLKILLSAYACEPNKGSEPGVGWNWALELANMGHTVWILTRRNNRKAIETALPSLCCAQNISFIYHDLPDHLLRFKKVIGTHLYYSLWQRTALERAQEFHSIVNFDCAHHLTFGSWRQTSHLHKLGIPFLIGPIGGAEMATLPLVRSLPWLSQLSEGLRYVFNVIAFLNPTLMKSLRSGRVISRTRETQRWLQRAGIKSEVSLEIGVSDNLIVDSRRDKHDDALRLIFVGRLIGWKGILLAIRATARARAAGANVFLTIVGDGSLRTTCERLVLALRASHFIQLTGALPQRDVFAMLSSHDALLFPSMHDSGGTIVLEAFAHGLPVICLDRGGPGALVDGRVGVAISTESKAIEKVVADLAVAICKMASDASFRRQASSCATERASANSWSAAVRRVYESPSLNC